MGRPARCPKCGEVEFLDSCNEITCRSCEYKGNPQIVFPGCPICGEFDLECRDDKVICKNTECGYSAKADAASLKCIYRILGYSDEKMQHEDISQYAILCPDCCGEAIYDHNKDIVYCYTCGGGWTNEQFRECDSCGEIKLRDEMTDGVCCDCKDWDEDEDDE